MTELTFGELLTKAMFRVKASSTEVASAISTQDDTVTRQTIYNWQKNLTKPNLKNRIKIIELAKFLRMSKIETNVILRAAGFTEAYEVGEDLMGSMFADYVSALLNELALLPYPVIALLNQANWDEPSMQKVLLFHAAKKYSNIFNIQPPYTGSERYFATLAQQCEFDNVKNGADFEWQLREELAKNNEPLLLLVSRLEQGDEASRMQLIGIIRSLSDEYENLLHVILCGGEMLEKIYYQEGISGLNNGIVKRWPELRIDEVKAVAEFRFELELSDTDAEKLLKTSGGHPKLLNSCLENFTSDNYVEKLQIWHSFTPFIKNKDRISNYLQQECIAKAQPFILDDLVRKLYWKNLLVERDGELCWRCETIRNVGKEIFGLKES